VRVVSLLPGATEIIAALGGEHFLVGISHECDYPPSITHLPRVTWTPVDPSAPSGAIDAGVRALRAEGRPVITVNADYLTRLRSDLLITQGLCEVCAVADGTVHRLTDALTPSPRVFSLTGGTLAGIEGDIRGLGEALDLASEAEELVLGMRARLRHLSRTAPPVRPRVVCIEWLDPLYLAGHWVPEQIAAAGGEPVGPSAGEPSRPVIPEALVAFRPDLVVVALCGFGVERALAELERTPLPPLGAPVWLLDGNAYTSRPGPRLVDGARRIQAAIQGREMPGLVRKGEEGEKA
jgi:iron complex transport system substrate-binding protein